MSFRPTGLFALALAAGVALSAPVAVATPSNGPAIHAIHQVKNNLPPRVKVKVVKIFKWLKEHKKGGGLPGHNVPAPIAGFGLPLVAGGYLLYRRRRAARG